MCDRSHLFDGEPDIYKLDDTPGPFPMCGWVFDMEGGDTF